MVCTTRLLGKVAACTASILAAATIVGCNAKSDPGAAPASPHTPTSAQTPAPSPNVASQLSKVDASLTQTDGIPASTTFSAAGTVQVLSACTAEVAR